MDGGDISQLSVGAVVNAANKALAKGGGVDGAIRDRAGPRIEASLAFFRGCSTGKSVVTPGFDLPAKWVIHAVGPDVRKKTVKRRRPSCGRRTNRRWRALPLRRAGG